MDERDFIALIAGVHQLVKAPTVLIWDRLNTHVSHAMRELIAEVGNGHTSIEVWPTLPLSFSTVSRHSSATGSNAFSTGPTPSTAS